MTTTAAPSAPRPILVSSAPRNRLDSIDLLRGIVMVLMALDHTRDFALAATFQFSPTDLSQTTIPIFFTRWVTHYCAPIFVFLAGTGSYLQRLRGKSASELSRFLITRGLWLVVLEFTAVRVLWLFTFDYSQYLGMAQVIWAIGCAMIGLGLLVRFLSPATLGVLGLAIVSFHNVLDRIPSPQWVPGVGMPPLSFSQDVWKLLHGAGFLALGHPYPIMLTGYGLIPWFGVILLGYGLGLVYSWDAETRQRFLVRAGIAAILAFIAIRAVNQYGDPAPWSTQRHPILSFLNVTKYPPSLDFLLMTLGPALIALALFERVPGTSVIAKPLITFGRVPFFFYLLQWPTTKGLTLLASVIAHKPTSYLFGQPPLNGPIPDGAGFSLGVTYLLWALAIMILYPLCAWYAGVKRRHRDWWWLSYL